MRRLTKEEWSAIALAKEVYVRHARLTEEALEAVTLVYQVLSLDNPDAWKAWESARNTLFMQQYQNQMALEAFSVSVAMVDEVQAEEVN